MPTERQCSHCDRRFTRTEHLLRHVRTHTKEKPFKCAVCSKAYSREDTLVRHSKSHHPDCVVRDNGIGGLTESHGDEMRPTAQGSPDGTARSVQSETSQSDHTPAQNELSYALQDPNSYMPFQEDLIAFDMAGTPQFRMSMQSPARGWDSWTTPCPDGFQASALNNGFAASAVDIISDERHNEDMEMEHQELPMNLQSSEVLSPSDFNRPPPIHNVERIWFTTIRVDDDDQKPSSTTIAQATPDVTHCSGLTDVDDEYRLQLTKAVLTPQPSDDPLPASDFLNLCVRMYFTRFNPIFPIVHGATFQPTAENSLLILSITSIGCLFLGSPAAVRRGRQIFKRLNKAILASWESVIVQPNNEPLAMLQAAVLGQTFALLSGESRDLVQCETFHGSVITLARRRKIFGRKAAISEAHGVTHHNLDMTWRLWARREEMNRICAAIQLHDAELSALLHTEPLLRHGASHDPPLCSSETFSASTAAEWASTIPIEANVFENVVRSGELQQNFHFSAYVSLEGFGTSISKDRREGRLDDLAVDGYHDLLLDWYNKYGELATNGQPEQFSLKMLWHSVYMCLLVDFDQLECAIGRDGPEASESGIEYIADWISSPQSTRCILHAFLAQRQLQSLPFDSVPALHVPRILFSAAVTWYCYLQYGPSENVGTLHLVDINARFPELGILDSPAKKYLSEITQLNWKRGNMSELKAITLCELGDLLQHIKHWGIAGAFANIVAYLIYCDPQDIIRH